MWLGDKASGIGVLEYASGDIYEGSWENDQRHGYGKFVSVASGAHVVYEGFWKDGVKHGKGKVTLANQERFEGSWSSGVLDGPVFFSFPPDSPWTDPDY